MKAYFDYDLIFDLPRDIVKKHVAAMSASNLSVTQKRYRAKGKPEVADLLAELHKEIKIEAITAAYAA